ncbi:MAG: ATP-binding protein [Clostridia bacterium]|nr:ATP-binding protein [Clostridia bacterium]
MFVGRETELENLNNMYKSEKADFVAVYGRRRIGKTELIRQFCRGKPCVHYTCKNDTKRHMLADFARHVIPTNPKLAGSYPGFRDWEEAISYFGKYDNAEKLVVVIDEFPYMAKADPSVMSVLQILWDEDLHDKNIMIILSGSSMSFMAGSLLSYENPLYGRITAKILLKPLPFFDAVKFFPDYSDEDKVLAYSVLGGVPANLLEFDPSVSFEENVKTKILSPSSRLYGDPDSILRQELRDISTYADIIRAVANGYAKFSEICTQSYLANSALTPYLSNLVTLGIVQKQYPAFSDEKDKAKISNARYTLCDNFFRFYYRFVDPNISQLEYGEADDVWKYTIEPHLHEFASKTFEEICISYMYDLNTAGKLPAKFQTFSRWWGKQKKKDVSGKIVTTAEEIDLVSLSYDKGAYILGECKFRNSPFQASQLRVLKGKDAFGGDSYYYLFSLSGFSDAVIEESKKDGRVFLVSLSDIVRGNRENVHMCS